MTMKTSSNAMLRAAAAAVLTLASSAALADISGKLQNNGALDISDTISTSTAGIFSREGEVVAGARNVTFDNKTFFAFCIDPMVKLRDSVPSIYTATTGYQPSSVVQQLYQTSYKDALSDNTHAAAFQLALWELNNDNSTGFSSGDLVIDDLSQPAVALAIQMMNATAVTGDYSFTKFTSNTDFQDHFLSQNLLAVTVISAVPEADTYAMLLAGLGVIGFMRRRKAA
ncbi:hypothetical protein AAKU55_001700 [Oxalobacteraceae bacterium GrIS 1.11]